MEISNDFPFINRETWSLVINIQQKLSSSHRSKEYRTVSQAGLFAEDSPPAGGDAVVHGNMNK